VAIQSGYKPPQGGFLVSGIGQMAKSDLDVTEFLDIKQTYRKSQQYGNKNTLSERHGDFRERCEGGN